MRRLTWAAVAAVLVVSGATVTASADKPPCKDNKTDGGSWTGLNGDLSNTRSQPAEDRIGVGEAGSLVPAWTFSGADVGIPNGTRSTPVVSGGCVFLAFGQGYLGDRGDVVALDADTGKLVWHTQFDASVLGLAVHDGLVYATPSQGTRGDVALPVVTDTYQPSGSYAVALDASTGAVRWKSQRLDDGNASNGTFIQASPVVYEVDDRALAFITLSGGSGDGAKVPMYFLDARTGEVVKKAYSLTDAEYAAGFGGTGIWSTAAYDPDTRSLYAGTADSDGKTKQHPYNDAILRIDADPASPAFGTVVDAYTGVTEHADLDAVTDLNPACTAGGVVPGTDLPTFFDTSASPECLELDFDFGASPNLYRSNGRTLVSALQKSGVFHAVDTASMTAAWTFTVGPGGAAMDAGTAALDETGLHVGATPNLVFDLDPDDGSVVWAGTTGADVFAYQPLTVAHGVLYAINDTGHLLASDAATGLPLADRDLTTDGGFDNCLGVGAGVAVAQHTVFAPCDAGGTVDLAGVQTAAGGLVAYRLP